MTCHDHYPVRSVVLNLVGLLALVVVGAILVARLGWFPLVVYALLGGLGTMLSLAWGCTRCRYYGQACGLGLGKLAALCFQKRSEEEFGLRRSQTVAWTLVGLMLALPAPAGLLSLSASRTASGLALLLIFLSLLVATALTHSRLVCRRCLMARDGRCALGRVAGLTQVAGARAKANPRKEK